MSVEKAKEKIEYIMEMTTYDELFHDGVNIDIRDLCIDALEELGYVKPLKEMK